VFLRGFSATHWRDFGSSALTYLVSGFWRPVSASKKSVSRRPGLGRESEPPFGPFDDWWWGPQFVPGPIFHHPVLLATAMSDTTPDRSIFLSGISGHLFSGLWVSAGIHGFQCDFWTLSCIHNSVHGGRASGHSDSSVVAGSKTLSLDSKY